MGRRLRGVKNRVVKVLKIVFWEGKRLRASVILLAFWVLYWGIKDSIDTVSLLVGFVSVAVILAYLVRREFLIRYDWETKKRFDEVWKSKDLAQAILAASMFFGGVVIYAATLLSMAIVVLLLKGM